ncbi:MAG: ECF-type sigma factor, partial [Planctomycetota bacterium]
MNQIEAGDERAVDRLILAVYQELRHLAAKKLQGEAPGKTLQPTALVHEAYLRLLSDQDQTWKSRTHFFFAAAEAMRRILVDNARRKKSLKRGDKHQRV